MKPFARYGVDGGPSESPTNSSGRKAGQAEMHWEVVEVLTLISGLITAGGFLILPDAEQSTRLRGASVGVFFVIYAFWAASQSSGIILIPVGSWAVAAVVVYMLYAAYSAEKE